MPKAHNKELALNALLSTASITDAATVSKLSEAILRRYLANEKFLAEYRAARRQTVEAVIAQMQNAAGLAVETLKTSLHCENSAVAVRASQIILDFTFKGLETTDISERLEKIENEYQTQIEDAGKPNNQRRF